MFLSKIWIFLLAIAAAIALTLALVMPRPAQRAKLASDRDRLRRACGVAEILLRDSARNRMQLAGEFSRAAGLDDALAAAGRGEIVRGEHHTQAKTLLQALKVDGSEALARRLDVALLDRRGRVVARSGKKAATYGDSMAGYFLVDDALDGYLRDDVWIDGGALYLVAGAPVVTRQLDWAGAVIVREAIDKDLADELATQLDAHVSFYVADEAVATSDAAPIHKEVLARFAELPPPGEQPDCVANEPFVVDAGDQSYWVQLARLPGEAGALGAFYAVFAEHAGDAGIGATIGAVTKDDLSFGNFPWLAVGGLFLVMVIGGIALTIVEADRPVRRLGADAVKLAKGEGERLDEIRHRGRYGSIARSVNIAIDKIAREAKSAKKDLDNLLGPLPGAAALPASGPRGEPAMPFAPPPPSEFKFKGSGGAAPVGAFDKGALDLDVPAPPSSTPNRVASFAATNEQVVPASIALPPTPKPPLPSAAKTPPPRPIAKPTPRPAPPAATPAIEEDPLGRGRATGVFSVEEGEQEPEDDETRVAPGMGFGEDADAPYFREVFSEFVALKKQCGESTESLTFAKFSRKLAANRDTLIEKHGCKTVRFQVYVKDGKAALKASPVRG
jgi:hypothetical protein